MGITKEESREKYNQLKDLLTKNPKATYDQIREAIGVSKGFITRNREKALRELKSEGKIDETQPKPYESSQHEDKEKGESVATKKEPSLSDIYNELINFKFLIKKGGNSMPDEKTDVREIVQAQVAQEMEKFKKDIENMFAPYRPLLEKVSKEEEEKRRREAEEAKKREIEEVINKAVEPLRKMVCDENGNCRLVTKEEFEELRKQGKVETEDERKEDTKFLEEAKKRTYLSSQLLDIILSEPENDKVAVAKRVMKQCKTKEECERLKDYICREHPTLCTLVTEKFEERKEEEREKGNKGWFLESEKKEKVKA